MDRKNERRQASGFVLAIGTMLLLLPDALTGAIAAHAAVVGTAPQVPLDPPANLVGWWSGDGNTSDLVGGNNGTLLNGATFAPGKVGQAFSFDGINDVLTIPDSPSLSITGSITIEAWVRLNAYSPEFAPVLSKWNDLGVNNRGWFLAVLPDGRLRFDVSHTGGDFQGGAISSATVALNQFVHVAGVFESNSMTLRTYINGTESGTFIVSFSTLFDQNEPLLIGAGDLGGNIRDFLNGLVDEPSVYNRALSASEIQAIFNAGILGKSKPVTTAEDTPLSVTLMATDVDSLSLTFSATSPAHGSLGAIGPGVTPFDPPGAVQLGLPAISNNGNQVGFLVDSTGATRGYERFTDGTFSAPIVDPLDNGNFTRALGINSAGVIVGDYVEITGQVSTFHGFVLDNGSFTTFDIGGPVSTSIFAINENGDWAGTFGSDTQPNQGFIKIGASVTTFGFSDNDGLLTTFAAGINNLDQIVGQYTDRSGNTHAYIRAADGTLTSFDMPNSTLTLARGINDFGVISGTYQDASGQSHGFVGTLGNLQSFDVPGAVYTFGSSVNNAGILNGTYQDSAGGIHGFVAMVQCLTGGAICATVTYTPNATYIGPDSFTYKANDGSQDSNIATVLITVVPPQAPVISSLSPTSGPVGSSVTIHGFNFGATQGSSMVISTCGSECSFTWGIVSWSDMQIVATVPTGALSGTLFVKVNNVFSNGLRFTVGLLDQDKDGIPDLVDNCPTVANPDQRDSDHDGVGDACDNAPHNFNPNQEDSNGNGVGDAGEGQGALTVPAIQPGTPADPFKIIVKIVFQSNINFNGTTGPFQVVIPDETNLSLTVMKSSTMEVVPPTRSPESPIVTFADAGGNLKLITPTTPLSDRTFFVTLDLSQSYPNLPPDSYKVRIVYYNYLTDLDVDPHTGLCTNPNGCFDRIWTGTVPGEVNLNVTELAEAAKVWLGLKNSDDVGTKFDLRAEVRKNGVLVSSGELDGVPGGSTGFNNAILDTIPLSAPVVVSPGDTLSFKLFVRNTCSGSTHNSGTARLWYNDAAANSRFNVTLGGVPVNLFLQGGFGLATTPGSGPKSTMDVFVDNKQSCPNRSFTVVGEWIGTP